MVANTLATPSAAVRPPRLFGTDGVHKTIGTELTPVFLSRLISAFAKYLDGPGPVLVARDYRTTSDGLARIAAGTLQMNGVDVYEMGAMPTPCLRFNVPVLQGRAGLMITASHHPTELNGIRFAGPLGLDIPPEAEREIELGFAQSKHRFAPWDQAGRIREDRRGIERYLSSILAHVDRGLITTAAPRVLLDCGNGTSGATSPLLLRNIGCKVTTLNVDPDAAVSGHSDAPTDESFKDLKTALLQFGAVLGIAHDGDSERVAFLDEKGRYVPGELSLALFAQDVLRRKPGATIVTSVSSSSAIEEVVKREGGKLFVTRSGSLPVAVGIADESAAFGGEENGQYYWPEHQNAPDGSMSSAKMVELLLRAQRPLSELVDELPAYVVLKTEVPLPSHLRTPVMERARDALVREADRAITIDGVKAFFPDGWVLVRPSDTEPVCRIFAESRSAEKASALVERGMQLISGLVAALQPQGESGDTWCDPN